MSKKMYYRLISALGFGGKAVAFVGCFLIMFVVCCADTEDPIAISKLIRILAIGVFLTAVGTLAIWISVKGRRGHVTRSSRY